jgi:hypothetical protein
MCHSTKGLLDSVPTLLQIFFEKHLADFSQTLQVHCRCDCPETVVWFLLVLNSFSIAD